MRLFKFNPLRSMTIQGALVAAGGYVVGHLDPMALSPTAQTILTVGGVLWSIFGARNAIAKGPTP